jgi:tetratricopeptide (TPR) repeat protein
MGINAPAPRQTENSGVIDPLGEAKRKLFPPLRNRNLAQAADSLAANRADLAGPIVSGFLKKHPNDPSALNLMADIARRAERFEEAEQLLSRCVELSDCAGYTFNYAVVLRRLDKFDEALAHLDKLLTKEPRNPLFREQKAEVLHLKRRHDEALAHHRELSEEYPASPEVWLNYGDSMRIAGHADQCVAAYRKALELSPALGTVFGRLADLRGYSFTEADVRWLEKQSIMLGLSADDRANLHFVLGNAYNDQKLYPKSFDNYAKANALRRLGVEVNSGKLATHISNCQSVLTEHFFHERSNWGCGSDAPIFIVGMPRSGSTLLEQILSAHSAIEGLGEIPDLIVIAERLVFTAKAGRSSLAHAEALRSLGADDCRSLGEQYLELTCQRRKPGRPYFTDKTLTNFERIGLIHLILPNAKIIDARRHPLDCGWSCFKSHFPGGQPFSHRLGDIGRHYVDYVRLMAHFDRVLPGKIHRVIYEDVVASPASEVRRLFDYLGLPFEEQCLRFHENLRPVRTLSAEQVRMPLYRSGMGQWRPYEPWLGPLKAALGRVLDVYPDAPD